MKARMTFTADSLQGLENRLALKQLAFERCMDQFDIHGANIAAAQMEWLQSVIREKQNLSSARDVAEREAIRLSMDSDPWLVVD